MYKRYIFLVLVALSLIPLCVSLFTGYDCFGRQFVFDTKLDFSLFSTAYMYMSAAAFFITIVGLIISLCLKLAKRPISWLRKWCQVPFIGLPLPRTVILNLCLSIMVSDHASEPNGFPLFTALRAASSSDAVSANWRKCRYLSGSGIGGEDTIELLESWSLW